VCIRVFVCVCVSVPGECAVGCVLVLLGACVCVRVCVVFV